MESLIQISNAQINTVIVGSGPPILFVHGFPFDHSMWKHQIEYFSSRFTVVAPDLRGFGKSSAIKNDQVLMEEFANDLAELVEDLNLSDRFTLCGLSMGGYIAWQLLKFHRRLFRRLILCNTRAGADDELTARGRHMLAAQVGENGVSQIAEQMPDKLLGADSIHLKSEFSSVIAKTSPFSVAAAHRGMAERPDMTWFLESIDLPTLVVAGEQDQITPPSDMRDMACQIVGAHFVELERAGHLTPMEKPDAFNQILDEFLTDSA